MKAVCVYNSSRDLPKEQRGRLIAIDEHFDLTIGRPYVVLAMGVWENLLQVLVRDDAGSPCFCHAALFDIEAQPLPENWLFAYRDGIRLTGRAAWSHWSAVWGYSELVLDERHMNNLGERFAGALDVFEAEYIRASSEDREETE